MVGENIARPCFLSVNDVALIARADAPQMVPAPIICAISAKIFGGQFFREQFLTKDFNPRTITKDAQTRDREPPKFGVGFVVRD
jgi:hypothetical protein